MACSDSSYLNRIPKNFILSKSVPQIEILKRSDLYICHGGFSSVMESVHAKVAILVVIIILYIIQSNLVQSALIKFSAKIGFIIQATMASYLCDPITW